MNDGITLFSQHPWTFDYARLLEPLQSAARLVGQDSEARWQGQKSQFGGRIRKRGLLASVRKRSSVAE